ncbi:glycerophosphodiester phosphodiesterase [Streptococcus dysgalactiae]|uniref:glycerophosphodiester phosphodiesterase n=1 Tax=Streptococcus dysgalactiae TaxID=1334 RepID=UPI0022842D6D|nr:glycerophosphodiester phosphodiesterase [Streptococcus dysgalactiae]MCY7234534.1 glycerophosphodiester phosphodiesterase [Streptococcus dysgalactiae]
MKLLSDLLLTMSKIRFSWLLKASVFQLLFVTMANFALSEFFYIILGVTGQYHLDKDNFFTFLKNPLALALLFLYLLLFAAFIHLEFFALYRIIADQEISVRGIKKRFSYYLKRIWKTFSGYQLILFVGYVLLTIPVLHLGLSSVITEKLYIPEFIVGELSKTVTTKYLLYVAFAFLFYLNLRLIYFLPLLAIKHRTVKEAMIESWQRTKGYQFSLVIRLLAVSAVTFLFSSTVISIVLALVYFFNPSGNQVIIQTISLTIIWELIFFATIFLKLCSAIILKEDIAPQKEWYHPKKVTKRTRGYAFLFVLLTLGFAYQSLERLAFFQTPTPKAVIAHRGLVSAGVENSLEALEGAKKAKSDYVELDLILTKDNRFVVSHDNHLKRLAGLDEDIRHLTLAEVEQLRIQQGKFSSHFVSFETFYKRAKNLKMPLLIELKPTGSEPNNYVDLFLEEYHRLGISKENKVMSLNLKVMEAIKKKDPSITAGYVIPIQFGLFGDETVDFYVIEDFSYRSYLSTQAFWKNKEVYVWTINDSSRIEHYLLKPIQGIITDKPGLTRYLAKDLRKDTSYFDRLIRIISSLY